MHFSGEGRKWAWGRVWDWRAKNQLQLEERTYGLLMCIKLQILVDPEKRNNIVVIWNRRNPNTWWLVICAAKEMGRAKIALCFFFNSCCWLSFLSLSLKAGLVSLRSLGISLLSQHTISRRFHMLFCFSIICVLILLFLEYFCISSPDISSASQFNLMHLDFLNGTPIQH